MSMLLSQSGKRGVQIPPFDAVAVAEVGPVTAEATFGTDGNALIGAEATLWFSAQIAGIGNTFEIRAESAESGSMTGTFDTWLSLGTARSWSITANTGASVANVTFKIRTNGSTESAAERVMQFIAEVVV